MKMLAQKLLSSLFLPFFLLALAPIPTSATSPTSAPGATSPPRERFEDTSQVLAVEVPVNVTGRDGQPVRGLKASDFEVFDEGRAQPITSFEMVDLDLLGTGGAAPGGPASATVRPAASPKAGEPLESSARRHFLLLFDLSFSNPIAILKARLAARDFLLNSLKPTDLAAVATFSIESGPRLVVTFTPDRAQLARAIDTLGTRRLSPAVERLDPLHFVIEDPVSTVIAGLNGPNGTGGRAAEAKEGNEQALLESLQAISKVADRDQKTFERNRVKSLTRAMGDMARALDSVKGRKSVIYFSEGFDSRLLLGNAPEGKDYDDDNLDLLQGHHERVDSDNRYGNTELQSAVNDMLEQFRRADCVIQAVDIGGLRAGGDLSGTIHNTGQDALFYMANETGGELFKDANNLRQQLDRVLDRTDVTYLLTFQRADLKSDGAYHRLRVRAKLPSGARLSYRTGYYAPRPFKELAALERNLLASDAIASAVPRRDLDLSLLVTSFRSSGQTSYVPVIIEVGGKSLLVGQKGDRTSLEIYTYVTDAKGEMRDFFTQAVGLDLKKGRKALLESGVKYYGHLSLSPGQYRVRVLVRNNETGRTGIETAALSIPAHDTAQPDLLPPLFFEVPGRWLLVRERAKGTTPGQEGGSIVYPFTVNGVPYVPAARPALTSESKAQLCLVAYNMGTGSLAVNGQVLSAAGQEMPGGSLALVERTATGIAGFDKLLATFEPRGLAAGSYVLRVAVSNPATGSKRESSVPFVVN
jgi:VWFA-related protein